VNAGGNHESEFCSCIRNIPMHLKPLGQRTPVKPKLVAQLDCQDSTDGDKAILDKIAKVDGVVRTNAVVRPRKG
jgi:hypothetical protein